ncbi:asparagine synthase (glutamine-hydrolyzing) [Salinirubellus salinus]|uniref:Putative asparagine synthetase [glutamine-hydrolyzing] n=1 Tax=Salinirubellus salinus TaxID=1364945 RepID=A0A9E7R260_9EURY|nr:asparagine synthase (glutamine-hydrolyzing) [Salinirubellus salinus]UWM54381.1 asparagine synthase (glutamine-hydrolyzing) [Salinirubellus salinus]
MCGIGGILSFESSPPDVGERMNSVMGHRGPDASGIYESGRVLLAHRRLSILDLSDAGRQPMKNRDGTVRIVFNGEIYNYRELRDRVSHYTFRSETDTEVLLHLYEEYGVECLRLLRGMFAFAIWDESRERLFLARDRVGQKPLFYHHTDDAFRFGSTISAILTDDAVEAVPDLAAIRSYLTYQYVPRPRTGFDGISQLNPGEYMLVSDGEVTRRPYWSLSFERQFRPDATKLATRLRAKLLEATRLRMRSDVPVGVFLSGGIDSSIVTALMDAVSETPVKTYSIGFDEDAFTELEFARTVAEQYGTDHTEYTVTPDSTAVLADLVSHYEMPFGDPSALPTYYVSQAAADDVTVVLTGDAGDENFAGYDRYYLDALAGYANRLPSEVRTAVPPIIDALPEPARRATLVKHARRFLESVNGDDVERYANFVIRDEQPSEEFWTGPEPSDELAHLRRAFDAADGPTRLDRLMQVDVETYLPDVLLTKVDRASMAHSIEVRSPFLDHDVMEFTSSIPADLKRRGRDGKWLLKRAFEPDLPEAVLDRSKQGFGVPVNEWFRGELRDEMRDRLERLGTRPPFDSDGLTALLSAHTDRTVDAGYRLWDLMMLDEWYEQFVEG